MKIQVFGGSGFVGSEFTRQPGFCLANSEPTKPEPPNTWIFIVLVLTFQFHHL